MTRFSANLGFLWRDRTLPQAIRAAKAAGFAAVECHWPYDEDQREVILALEATGLPMLGLNTRRGNVSAGDNGLAALPGREAEAREAIDHAVAYASALGARHVHVMAGRAEGRAAHDVFVANLHYACEQAGPQGLTILIEALNGFDAPGYFLRTTDQAAELIEDVAAPNLKMMFDCYHVGRSEGDVLSRLATVLPIVGHIQFASVPDRGPPDQGDLNYADLFAGIAALGWTRPLGAEYLPQGDTDASLGWMLKFS